MATYTPRAAEPDVAEVLKASDTPPGPISRTIHEIDEALDIARDEIHLLEERLVAVLGEPLPTNGPTVAEEVLPPASPMHQRLEALLAHQRRNNRLLMGITARLTL